MRLTTEAFTVHTAENCGNSAVAVFYGRRHFLHGAESDFHGLAVQQTMVFPRLQFLNAVIDVPVVQVVQVHFTVPAQRLFPVVQMVRRTIGVLQLPNTVAYVPVVQVELDYWCRREGDSRDLAAAAVEKSLAPGGSGSSPWWSWFDGWIF